MIEQFRDAIRDAGLEPLGVIEPDGKIHRFATNGKRGDDDTILTSERRGHLPAQRTDGGIILFKRLDVERLAAERKKLRGQSLHHHGDSDEPP